jgi:plasmid stability protein
LLGGGIAVLLVLVLALPPLLVGGRSPESEARGFLQAIVDADVENVREHIALPTDGTLDVALTEPVLRAAVDRVDRFTIEAVAVDGDLAEVTADVPRRPPSTSPATGAGCCGGRSGRSTRSPCPRYGSIFPSAPTPSSSTASRSPCPRAAQSRMSSAPPSSTSRCCPACTR